MNLSTCDQCGVEDDHPKVHSSEGATHHHDCLPAAAKFAMIASSPQAAAIIEAAESGTHGDELRKLIVDLHS